MKKFVAALLALTMVLALVSTAFAYVDKPLGEDGSGIMVQFTGSAWGYGKVTNNYGKNKSSVALRKGSYAIATAIKGDWYKILVPARAGSKKSEDEFYFNKKYITTNVKDGGYWYIFSSGGSGRSGVVSEDDDYYASKDLTKYKKVTVKSGRRTNVRSTPSLAGKSIGVVGKGHSTKTLKLHKDKIAVRDNRGVFFYKVIYKGKARWISEQYTTLKK